MEKLASPASLLGYSRGGSGKEFEEVKKCVCDYGFSSRTKHQQPLQRKEDEQFDSQQDLTVHIKPPLSSAASTRRGIWEDWPECTLALHIYLALQNDVT